MGRRSRDRSSHSTDQRVVHPYRAVYVLLASWQDDDLGVWTEIDKLEVLFSEAYGYQVEQILIPSHNPDDVFGHNFQDFIQKYQHHQNLLIVYYGGHGRLNNSRLAEWSW